MTKRLIAPSLLSADFTNLNSEIDMINQSKADFLHLDIMDGVFVPNITFGWPIISQIRKICHKPLDVHLMIMQPERYIKEFAESGADIITVHYEACIHLHRTINAIKELGIKAGVSLNPHTPVAVLENILEEVDLVLIMSVNPGFGGQSFIRNSLNKLNQLKEIREAKNLNFLIEIDGGVNLDNVDEISEAGADILVAGNAVFKTQDPKKTIETLKYKL
jgi:ribulose-phosphate 3-epimerase